MITMFQPHWLYLLFCKHTHHAPTSAPLNLSFPLPGSTSFIYLHGSPFISLWSLFKCYFIGEDFSDYDHLNYTNLKNFQSSFLIFPSCLLSQHLSPFDLISFLSSFLLKTGGSANTVSMCLSVRGRLGPSRTAPLDGVWTPQYPALGWRKVSREAGLSW